MTIIYIILGVLIWQSVCTIVLIVTNENEKVIIYTALGIWTPILMVVGKICQTIYLALSRKYNYYQVYINGTFARAVYMTPKTAKKFQEVDVYTVKLLREGKNFKSCPRRKDIVKNFCKL